MPKTLVSRLTNLGPDEAKALESLMGLRNKYEAVPAPVISRVLGLSESGLVKALSSLVERGLVRARLVSGEYAYEITRRGVDALAVSWLVTKGFITDLGERLGVGKESEVYLAWTPSGSPVTVKLHREGLKPYRNLRRVRGYSRGLSDWVEISISTASREFSALLSVSRAGGLVPRPIVAHLNAVVTEYVEGLELFRARLEGPEDAQRVLDDIVATLRAALGVGIVHGDLSPYNVLVSEGDRRGYIIDWSQYVPISDPSAQPLLERDIKHLASFFERKFGASVDVDSLVRSLKGG